MWKTLYLTRFYFLPSKKHKKALIGNTCIKLVKKIIRNDYFRTDFNRRFFTDMVIRILLDEVRVEKFNFLCI